MTEYEMRLQLKAQKDLRRLLTAFNVKKEELTDSEYGVIEWIAGYGDHVIDNLETILEKATKGRG